MQRFDSGRRLTFRPNSAGGVEAAKNPQKQESGSVWTLNESETPGSRMSGDQILIAHRSAQFSAKVRYQ